MIKTLFSTTFLSCFVYLSGLTQLHADTAFQTDIQTGNTSRTTAIQERILLAQKHKNIQFGLSGGTFLSPIAHIPPAPLDNYAPIVLYNNSGISADQIYFLGTGTTIGGNQHFLKPDLKTGVCQTVSPATYSSADSTVSVKLSQLPTTGTNAYLIYLPQQISGRCYFSLNTPLYLATTTTAISPPSVGTPKDANFYTLYQNFELTLDANYELWANISNVDFFCLPLGVFSYTYPSGAPYPTLDGLTGSGMSETTSRASVLTAVESGLGTQDDSYPPQWSKLAIPFFSNPYASSSSKTIRILAAKQSIPFATNAFVGAASPFEAFDSDYLQNYATGPKSGLSYMDALADYYDYNGSEQLELLIYPAGGGTANYIIKGDEDYPNLLNATHYPADSDKDFQIDLSALTTLDLLGGDIGAWNASGAIIPAEVTAENTEVAKTLSALFTAGLLPPGSYLEQPVNVEESYFSTYRSLYFNNPTGFNDYGPWFNLYDALLHPLMIQKDGFGLGYAYDFDDLLGLGGEMHVVIGSGSTVNKAYPYYLVSLGPTSSQEIPNPTVEFGPFKLTVNPVASRAIKIFYTTTSGGQLTEELTVPTGAMPPAVIDPACDYFIVEFDNDSSKQFKVYPKYQYVIPVGTTYTSTLQALSDGIAFDAVAGSGTEFTISLPNS